MRIRWGSGSQYWTNGSGGGARCAFGSSAWQSILQNSQQSNSQYCRKHVLTDVTMEFIELYPEVSQSLFSTTNNNRKHHCRSTFSHLNDVEKKSCLNKMDRKIFSWVHLILMGPFYYYGSILFSRVHLILMGPSYSYGSILFRQSRFSLLIEGILKALRKR